MGSDRTGGCNCEHEKDRILISLVEATKKSHEMHGEVARAHVTVAEKYRLASLYRSIASVLCWAIFCGCVTFLLYGAEFEFAEDVSADIQQDAGQGGIQQGNISVGGN